MPDVKTPIAAIQVISPEPTLVKVYAGRDGRHSENFSLSQDDLPLLVTSIQPEEKHYRIELAVPKDGRYTWYVFQEHVEQIDLPEYFLQAVDHTVIKRRIGDSSNLSPEDKFNFNTASQPLQANWIRNAENPKYFEFSLKKPVHGVHNWFAFKGHVRASNVESRVNAR